jgi:hypothetical protein
MNLFTRVKRSFCLAALALTLVLAGAFLLSSRVGSTPVSLCNPRYSTWVTYYSDATYTVEIGYRYIQCNGTGTLYGSSSPYQQSEIIDVCCADPGGNGCVPC